MSNGDPILSPDLETARRAKVRSVDPHGIVRTDLDGARDSDGVFRVLRSFDHRGLTPDELATRTLQVLVFATDGSGRVPATMPRTVASRSAGSHHQANGGRGSESPSHIELPPGGRAYPRAAAKREQDAPGTLKTGAGSSGHHQREQGAPGIMEPEPDAPAGILAQHVAYYRGLAVDPCPPPATPTVAEADEILRHRFRFYGEVYDLGPQIDWEQRFPDNEHLGHDLNRFHFLYPLVGAWQETHDRRYAQKAVDLILDWIARTDICDSFIAGPDPKQWLLSCKSRYVWLSHLEPAIHLVAWGKALATLLRVLPDLVTPAQFLQILKSVHDQLVWLEVISPEGGHGNGLVAATACQLETLAYFPALRAGPDVAQVAWTRLDTTLSLQLLPDGVQNELTPHYHCCVLEGVLGAMTVAALLPVPPPAALRARVRDMLLYLRQTVTPDGAQVAFNDGDGGSGAFARDTLARPIARELLGADADNELHSACYRYAGVMILRQGSRRGRDELYLAFDGGPFGGVHQHEDALSFWLSAYGRSFIVDPGRHMYDWSEKSFYPYLQTTKAHSTIRVDDCDQNSRAHPEAWVAKAPLPLTWREEADGTVVAGASYVLGYGPVQIPVRHTRTITFHPEPGYWELEDELTGDGTHAIESRFQFAPGGLQLDPGCARTLFPDANLALFFAVGDWDRAVIEKGERQPRAGWYSHQMQQLEPAPALALYAAARPLPFRTRVILHPYRGQSAEGALCVGFAAGQALKARRYTSPRQRPGA